MSECVCVRERETDRERERESVCVCVCVCGACGLVRFSGFPIAWVGFCRGHVKSLPSCRGSCLRIKISGEESTGWVCALSEGVGVRDARTGDLVGAEPLADRVKEAGKEAINVLNVLELLGPGVVAVDGYHLPISLAFVNHAQDPEHLDWPHFARLNLAQADFADVERVVVAAHADVRVHEGGVLPGARKAAVVEIDVALLEGAQLALLLVLLDWVERLLGRNFELQAWGHVWGKGGAASGQSITSPVSMNARFVGGHRAAARGCAGCGGGQEWLARGSVDSRPSCASTWESRTQS